VLECLNSVYRDFNRHLKFLISQKIITKNTVKMKKLISLGVFSAFILLLSSCKGCEQTAKQTPLYIYTFEPTASLTINSTKGLIEQFIGEKDPVNIVKSDENKVYFTAKSDLNDRFEQDLNTGNFSYTKGFGKYMGNYAPKLPTSKEAIKIADDFLTAQKLAPRNKSELQLLHEGGLRAMTTDGKNKGPVVDKLIELTYGRQLDSTPVIGIGSKIVVKVGENGEIIGLTRHWRELNLTTKKTVETAQMISSEEAESLARKQIAAEFGAKATAKITSVSKAYFDNNGAILQPVYAFQALIDLGDKKIAPFSYLCVVQLLKDSPEPLNLFKIDGRAIETILNTEKGQRDSLDTRRRKTRD
jgi:uncharacterized protein YuzE